MARPHRIVPGPGRPSKFSEAIADEVCGRLAAGEALIRICRDPHLPAEATIRNWVVDDKYPVFTQAYHRAREHQARRWFEEVLS
jgi:hypothetical protein